MVVAIISWALNLINPWTMFRPRTRTLWCALSGDLDDPFPIDCDENQDNVYTLKTKIREAIERETNTTVPHRGKLNLYCPAVQLDCAEKFKVEDGEKLHPRCVITSDPLFPDSKDPNVDVVVVMDGDATSQGNRERPKPQRPRSENDIPLFLSSLILEIMTDKYCHNRYPAHMPSRTNCVNACGHAGPSEDSSCPWNPGQWQDTPL